MSKFEDNLEEQFDNFRVSRPDFTKNQYYLYADFVELVAFFSKEDTTEADILDRIYDENINISEEIEIPETDDEIASLRPEIDDKEKEWISEVFDLLANRADLFMDDYPFIVNVSSNSIKIKDEINERNKIYLVLLFSSHLNYFKILQPSLTTEFEIISYYALLNFLPNKAIVKQFGKRTDYIGSAKEKIINLAKDLNVKYDSIVNEIVGNQEKGLDLAAWIPFDDKIPNMITLLAQCACGKEWYKKQNETIRFNNYFNFYRLKPIHSMFIPFSLYRDSDSFYKSEELDKKLLFERSRIIKNLNDINFFDNLDVKKIIEKSLEITEDIV